jgi:hypothetical protein
LVVKNLHDAITSAVFQLGMFAIPLLREHSSQVFDVAVIPRPPHIRVAVSIEVIVHHQHPRPVTATSRRNRIVLTYSNKS